MTALLQLEGVQKGFGEANARTEAIGNLTFTQHEREFLVIVGPSGCGKTTMLRCASGLIPIDGGHIQHRGQPVSSIPPWISVVFQEYNRSLFPWLSVEHNVMFALQNHPRSERRSRAQESLKLVGLEGFGNHYPWQLSGGMQQRTAIARSIAAEPELLLMDEPFASVDAQTRDYMEDMLLGLWKSLEFSVLFVTHDIDEAIYLADRVLVLSPRPTEVVEELVIDLPRPRDQLETKGLPRFQELRKEIYGLIGQTAGAA